MDQPWLAQAAKTRAISQKTKGSGGHGNDAWVHKSDEGGVMPSEQRDPGPWWLDAERQPEDYPGGPSAFRRGPEQTIISPGVSAPTYSRRGNDGKVTGRKAMV